MNIFSLSDLHLNIGVPEKTMEVFGPIWKDYTQKISTNWKATVTPKDLVLIAGDISWALKLEEAKKDLEWIDSLPGTKLLIKGNHDFWWSSKTKVEKILPPSIHILQNTAFNFSGVSIAGTRLWDSEEYNFSSYIDYKENPLEKPSSLEKDTQKELERKIFQRELSRLEMSLQQLDPKAPIKIAMTHYPPISADLKESKASSLLEKFSINYAVFGHLHQIKKSASLFGEKRNIHYLLTSADYLDFTPLLICQTPIG